MSEPVFSGKHRRDTAAHSELVYEDADLVIKHLPPDDSGTAYLGYLVLEARRPSSDIGDLTDPEAQKVGLWMSRLSRDLRRVLGADHVYAFVLGGGMPQLRVHLVARHPNTPPAFDGPGIADWPDAPRGDAATIANLVAQLRRRLGGALATPP